MSAPTESHGLLGPVTSILLMRRGRRILDGNPLRAELTAGHLGIEHGRILDRIGSGITNGVTSLRALQPSGGITYSS